MSTFTTSQNTDSTHIIDDGGCLYWITAPGKSNDDVAQMFRTGYDGKPGNFDVTDIATDERSDYGK